MLSDEKKKKNQTCSDQIRLSGQKRIVIGDFQNCICNVAHVVSHSLPVEVCLSLDIKKHQGLRVFFILRDKPILDRLWSWEYIFIPVWISQVAAYWY